MSGRQADTTQNQAGMHLRMEFGRESWKGESVQKLWEQNPDFYRVVFKRRVIFLGDVPGFSVPGSLSSEPELLNRCIGEV